MKKIIVYIKEGDITETIRIRTENEPYSKVEYAIEIFQQVSKKIKIQSLTIDYVETQQKEK